MAGSKLPIQEADIEYDEIWKPVVGYEENYEVSNKTIIRRTKESSQKRYKKGHILKPWICRKGYFYVRLYKSSGSKNIAVARIMAMAFIGMPQKGQEVNHKDGIKLNNEPENLEWITHKENQQHMSRVLGYKPPKLDTRGQKNGHAKLTENLVRKIKKLLQEKRLSQGEIGKIFNIKQATVSNIKTGKLWSHI